MVTVIGDPLYRPFLQPPRSAVAAAGTPHTEHDDWLLLQQVRREILSGQSRRRRGLCRRASAFPALGRLPKKLTILWTCCMILRRTIRLIRLTKKALADYTRPIRIRVGLKLAQYYTDHDKNSLGQRRGCDTLRHLYRRTPCVLADPSRRPRLSRPLPPSKSSMPLAQKSPSKKTSVSRRASRSAQTTPASFPQPMPHGAQ